MNTSFKIPFDVLLPLLVGAGLGMLYAHTSWLGMVLCLFLFSGLLIMIHYLAKPVLALWSAFVFAFFAIGITRYVDGPFGLLIDILLVLTWASAILKPASPLPWKNAANGVVYFLMCWFAYIVLQLFNPESLGTEPWFYAMRGIALYPLLFVPLVFILLHRADDHRRMIRVWLLISVLAALKGFGQKFMGCDPSEARWLAEGGAITHVLFGQLRAFSFYSDAGQFGAAMAHASLCCFVLMAGPRNKWVKYGLLMLALFFFWGYLISGTRGAIAVIGAGLMAFLLLSKNFKILMWGGLLAALFYYFMAFTTIGQGTYEIRRLRTAFTEGSNEQSLLVRLENQRRLKTYLADKPFGGGVGSAGDWGKRFHPDAVLANIATDSYYVRIWAETGVVGLCLMLFFFGFVLLRGAWIVWHTHDALLRNELLALYCGLIGIMAASYSNSVISQFPTALVCYASIAFLWLNDPSRSKSPNNFPKSGN